MPDQDFNPSSEEVSDYLKSGPIQFPKPVQQPSPYSQLLPALFGLSAPGLAKGAGALASKFMGIVPSAVAAKLPRIIRGSVNKTYKAAPDLINQAIEGAGGRLTPKGLYLDLIRHQKPSQAGSLSRSGGVFYSPTFRPNPMGTGTVESLHAYKQADYDDQNSMTWGGPQEIRGETLLRSPYFAYGLPGGRAVTGAGEVLFGRDYPLLQSSLHDVLHTSSANRQPEIDSFLRKYAPGVEVPLLGYDSNDLMRLGPWLRESAIGNKARQQGYDSMVVYGSGFDKPKIHEIFDLRESHYPVPEGGYKMWPQYKPKE